jgi:hypothetical protein
MEATVMDQSYAGRRAGFHAAWIAGVVIVVIAVIYGLSRYSDRPATTAMSVPDRPSAQGQPSPQGETGPVDTKSGGAPAASPQGDAPPGMQPQSR